MLDMCAVYIDFMPCILCVYHQSNAFSRYYLLHFTHSHTPMLTNHVDQFTSLRFWQSLLSNFLITSNSILHSVVTSKYTLLHYVRNIQMDVVFYQFVVYNVYAYMKFIEYTSKLAIKWNKSHQFITQSENNKKI